MFGHEHLPWLSVSCSAVARLGLSTSHSATSNFFHSPVTRTLGRDFARVVDAVMHPTAQQAAFDSIPALQLLLQAFILPRLTLREISSLGATCRAWRRVIDTAPDSAFQEAARQSGLPRTFFSKTRQELRQVAVNHERIWARRWQSRRTQCAPTWLRDGCKAPRSSCMPLCRLVAHRVSGARFSPDCWKLCLASVQSTPTIAWAPSIASVQLVNMRTTAVLQQVG